MKQVPTVTNKTKTMRLYVLQAMSFVWIHLTANIIRSYQTVRNILCSEPDITWTEKFSYILRCFNVFGICMNKRISVPVLMNVQACTVTAKEANYD